MAGLAPSFGRGAMTNHWVDIRNAHIILSMGGNSAEAHPVGFRWVMQAKERSNAILISIDPRYNRTTAVADYHAWIRTGTDIVFLGGLISYLIENNRYNDEYVRAYTDASLLVNQDFGFEDGLFTGYDEARHRYDRKTWNFQLDEQGFARRDPTLQDPRCVFQMMRQHYSRYTVEMVETTCGMPRETVLKLWDLIAQSAAPDKTMTILYALGWTQHSVGSQMIRAAAMVQLLLGNMGMLGGGVNALRGHSNIQGLTDIGLLSNLLPGYMNLASVDLQDYQQYLDKRIKEPLLPEQVSYWKYYERFFVSTMKAFYGDAATAENNWCYDWLPKLSEPIYDVLYAANDMANGKMTGAFCQGFNILAAFPDKAKMTRALSNLKYLVVMDPLQTETSEFWQNHGAFNDVDPSQIQTTVFRLPTTCFAEDDGSITNSSRWLQWHHRAAPPPGEARTDTHILGDLFQRIRRLYEQEGGAFPEPILNMAWDYAVRDYPQADELAREYNGRALADIEDQGRIIRRKGELLNDFGELRADGSTACGCWIYSGAWTEAGNMMDRRDNADPYDNGQTLGWAWAWPMNRRILYNRASARPDGTPWNPDRRLIWWNGERWVGADIPDYPVAAPPEQNVGPFILNQSGGGHFFVSEWLNEGPFPEHYEPFESPIDHNPLSPENPLAYHNPIGRVFEEDKPNFGTAKEFPYAATTYRLTEHFHYWTHHVLLNAIAQPEKFVEIGETLAEELGIKAGEKVRVTSKRGYIEAVAVVTKRLIPLQITGKTVHQVGIPIHWGFLGVAKKAFLTNTLTPVVGDGNTQTPEFKSFLVNVEKVGGRA
ncbi:formate dehydrogenase-N subunit alpha [Stutzerimonas nosocomialis]|nr:formate dehydrogenase-N subunit alpha [Stutzerimonas nosocomialis]